MTTYRTRAAGRPQTATEYAYATLKEWIVAGKLGPNERIDQDEVAAHLALSKMPVRSALDKLTAEGLVIAHPHRGVTVSPISVDELDDIYLVRCHLESLAISLATECVKPEDIATLHRMVDDQETLSVQPDLEAVLQANREFHMYIYRLSGRQVLVRVIENLWTQTERYRRIFLKQPGMVGGSTSDHRHIVELMAAGKTDEVARFLVEHNRKTQRVVLAKMKEEQEVSPQVTMD